MTSSEVNYYHKILIKPPFYNLGFKIVMKLI